MVQRGGAIKNRLLVLLLGNGMVSFGGWIDYIVILTVSVFTWKANQYDVAFIGAATLFPGIVLSKPIGMLVSPPFYDPLVAGVTAVTGAMYCRFIAGDESARIYYTGSYSSDIQQSSHACNFRS
ncbi:hypothetical protein [Bartonella sp. CL29QHWL]|uniref:hypothetical protein n=1 Tax=Bartonella sp. CL29QHWL TaxID=3243522 RepID=UPI0035CFD101